MAVLVAVGVVVVLFVIFDHLRYWKRLDEFEEKAAEFATLYNTLTPKIMNGDPEDPEIDEFMFEGVNYCATVKKGDLNSLYAQLRPYINDVLKSYDKIGERYLSMMDEETEARVSKLYECVQEIEEIIRYQCWLKGIK